MIRILFLATLALMCSCKNVNTDGIDNQAISFCDSIKKLDSLKVSGSNSNYHINNIVPLLESESGIISSCSKGTIGYMYFSDPDSIFYNDITKWAEYFDCD